MKKTVVTLLLFAVATIAVYAQPKPFKVTKNANHFVYATYDYGEHIDTHYTQIEIYGGNVYLVTEGERLPGEYHPGGWSNGPYIQGYSVEDIFVDESKDSITYLTTIFESDKRESYRTVAPFSRKDIKFDTDHQPMAAHIAYEIVLLLQVIQCVEETP